MSNDDSQMIRWSDVEIPRGPVLVAAFKGWNDAGSAASAALSFISAQSDREHLADIDPETFFDFQANRPLITLEESRTRKLEWPANEFFSCRLNGLDNGLLVLDGVEPSTHWRTFCQAVLDVATECEVKQIVTLGALLADVPHTRATTIAGVCDDDDLVERTGLRRSNYEGPTGIAGVLQTAANAAGFSACSLWAAVPHYVASAPNPMAALALVRSFEAVTGAIVDAGELEDASERYTEQVSAAVSGDEEISEYVKALEESADAEDSDGTTIPSGDAIAQEFQRFLRRRKDS